MEFFDAVNAARSKNDCLYRDEWVEYGVITKTIHLDKTTGKLFQSEYVNMLDFNSPWHPHLLDLITADWNVYHEKGDPFRRKDRGRWKLG